MIYNTKINGLDVQAEFHDTDVNHIFIPLLEDLYEYQKKKGGRIIVYLVAPPASGKSTLCSFLKYINREYMDEKKLSVIGMDGFHFDNKYLENNYLVRDGESLCLADIKGAPETFDVEKLKQYVKRIAEGENIMWPIYDRSIHSVIESGMFVDGDLVIIEGNYLLLESEGWNDLSVFADCTIGIVVEEELLKNRLVQRKIMGGMDIHDAEIFVERSDMFNVRLCQEKSKKTNISLLNKSDGSYMILI